MSNPVVPIRYGAFLPGTQHHVVEAEVGRGRYSIVYEVRDVRDNRLYAAKVLSSNNNKINQSTLKRFEREIYLGVGLKHPSVMLLNGVVNYGHIPIPLFEYAAAGTLYELVAEFNHVIELDTALLWMAQTAEGVAYLHSKNLIHRDITPKNILVRDNGSVFIGDLGMALDLSSKTPVEKYNSNIAPIHVSARQHRNPNSVSALDDIYALGQTFFFMLTRQLPQNIHTKVLDVNPRCPEEITRLVDAMRHPEELHRPRAVSDISRQCQMILKQRSLCAA